MKRRRKSRPGSHVPDPAEWTLPKWKLVRGPGRAWWFEPDGVEPMLGPDATAGEPVKPAPKRTRERQFHEWLDLARHYSTDPECIDAVKNLWGEYRAQVAAFRRWSRRARLVHEYWHRPQRPKLRRYWHRLQRTKLRRRRRLVKLPSDSPLVELPSDSPLLKPRRGERNAVDPRLRQWASGLGRYILAQDDPVTALERLLGEKHAPGKRTANTVRDQEIAAAVVAKMAGMTFADAITDVAREHGLSEERVRIIYFRGRVEAKAARYLDI